MFPRGLFGGWFSLDVQQYLDRLGAAAPAEISVQALHTLVRAHLEQVPFENLDIAFHPRPLSLAEEDLFEKVVLRRRGGYCFELNKLFYLLLEALGFRCCPACARILYRRSDPRPWSHRVSMVTLEGKRWLCDVGYGGPGPKDILCLDRRDAQTAAGEAFSVQEENGLVTVLRHDPDGIHPLMVIRDEPCPEVDFEVMNGYFSLHPRSVFTQKYIVYRCLPDGQLSLVGDRFTLQREGLPETVQTVADEPARLRLLRERFGIPI